MSPRQLTIARQLIQETFKDIIGYQSSRASKNEPKGDLMSAEEAKMENLRAERTRRTLKLIADPNYTDLYTMESERHLMTDYMLNEVIKNMIKQSSAQTSSVKIVATTLRQCLKVNIITHSSFLYSFLNSSPPPSLQDSLFGSEVNVGICRDASAHVIEFVSDNDYVRKVVRGSSTCFECLDQNDVVVQAVIRPQTRANAMANGDITMGEAVVYVPLLSKRGGVGILEIHGLHSEGLTDPLQYQRRTAALKAMIAAQDYRFQDSLRLWRIPSERSGGLAPKYEKEDYDKTHYHLVCGRLSDVAFEKNGVPYFGGARFTVSWEDGLVEEAMSASELIKLYTNTPQSLGNNTKLEIELTDKLLKLGSTAGEILESQRTKDALALLHSRIFVQNLSDPDIIERSLDASLGLVRGMKESFIAVWDDAVGEGVNCCLRLAPIRSFDEPKDPNAATF